MKSKLIVIVLSVLLIASITTNIILITKLNKSTTDATITDKDTDTTSDLIGVYYNESVGKIEFKDEDTFICQYNTEYEYEVIDKDIIFTYYINLEPLNDKCYAMSDEGKYVEVASCKQKQTKKGKIVDNGIIWENKLFYKVG